MRVALTLGRDADVSESNDYLRALTRAGIPRSAISVVTPRDPVLPDFDALVLGGGVDVDPARYGRWPLENGTVEVDAERDRIDFALFEAARKAGSPVLGICRGLQIVNVALGGTLVQDIPTERPSELVHDSPNVEKTRLDHTVAIEPGTILARVAGEPQIEVNSRHHQAIDALAPGLEVSGRAADGTVEAVEAPGDGWLVAVQWHPENLLEDPTSGRLFSEFARAAREKLARQASS